VDVAAAIVTAPIRVTVADVTEADVAEADVAEADVASHVTAAAAHTHAHVATATAAAAEAAAEAACIGRTGGHDEGSGTERCDRSKRQRGSTDLREHCSLLDLWKG
jgi:fructose-1,6-bisphosphatase/sedoheptulose 1,7-bisphosphatase-like protein